MLEEAIPALWSAVNGFFTPAVLFILLNIVIGTIAVTSKVTAPAAVADGDEGAGGEGGQQQRRLSRVPSMAFERLRSLNLSRSAAPAPELATVTGAVDLEYEQSPAAAAVEKEELEVEAAAVEKEAEAEHAHAHMERSRSEATAELEVQPRLSARLHKSASEMSAFSHFEAEEVEEAVRAAEARRPATTRDGAARRGRRRLPVAAAPEVSESESEPEEAAGGEVDAQAENFINKFRNQLKLQRMESILRYRETVRRGQAAAAAAGSV